MVKESEDEHRSGKVVCHGSLCMHIVLHDDATQSKLPSN